MFCAAVAVAGTCLFACSGTQAEFERAWQWPASVRWDNAAQALVDDYGPLPKLHRNGGDDVIWATEAEPSACAPKPAAKPAIASPADGE